MAENTGIEWADHTFNPWIGCTKISPACDNCYAAEWNKRYEDGKNWGPHAERRRTSEANWQMPRRWNRKAEKEGIRYRVFCASLADVFDNHKSIEPIWRIELWKLIAETPHLDWLLLTKRPQNIKKMLPHDWRWGYPNVWLGTTVENQKVAEQNIPHLLDVPAAVKFLSCEPLLGPIDFSVDGLWFKDCECPADRETGVPECSHYGGKTNDVGIDWVIAGGESGSNFRITNPDWFRSLRDQCLAAYVPFLFKQWGGFSQQQIKKGGRALDGIVHNGYPK